MRLETAPGRHLASHDETIRTGSSQKGKGQLTAVRCPFCLTHQTATHQNLLCSDCHNAEIELVRNSVIANDDLNSDTREEINRIFETSHLLQLGQFDELTYNDRERPDVIYNGNGGSNVPYPSLMAIKNLSLHLIRLETRNLKLKLKNMDKTKGSLELRIQKLRDKLEEENHKYHNDRTRITTTTTQLAHGYALQTEKLDALTVEYRQEKTAQIEKQSLQLQQTLFRTLRDIALTAKGPHLFLFCRPVLRLQDFLSYSNKLPVLNEFLEDLIVLQSRLFDIFSICNEPLHLPYLAELQGCLPDLRLHDLVQQKELFMVNGKQSLEESIPDDNGPATTVNNMDDVQRIVKLGNAIKLPLSSKTINHQLRRATLTSATPEQQTPEAEKMEKEPTNSILSTKRIVIVPHRILPKPFTKLTTKEYLKFLLVVVKILINFRDLLQHTLRFSEVQNRNVAHNSGVLRTPVRSHEMYDFGHILRRIWALDDIFAARLARLVSGTLWQVPGSASSSGSVSEAVSNASSASSSTVFGKPLHTLYSQLFRDSRSKGQEPIYGNISETEGVSKTKDVPQLETKTVMETVHRLISGTNRSVSTAMAQSRAQLEEWDVVLKMY